MRNKPTPKHSIERKNSKGNYEKENCYWATNREQSRNKSNNHYIEYNGENLILNDWESKTGIKATTIFNRIKNLKWSIEDSLTIKPKKNASTSKSDK